MGPRDCLDGCGKSRPYRDSIPGPSSPLQVAIKWYNYSTQHTILNPGGLDVVVYRLCVTNCLYCMTDGLVGLNCSIVSEKQKPSVA